VSSLGNLIDLTLNGFTKGSSSSDPAAATGRTSGSAGFGSAFGVGVGWTGVGVAAAAVVVVAGGVAAGAAVVVGVAAGVAAGVGVAVVVAVVAVGVAAGCSLGFEVVSGFRDGVVVTAALPGLCGVVDDDGVPLLLEAKFPFDGD